ncbi:anti-sigma factor family protein [Aidingimonas lacisalsi]|uniref:anti-sigma factor family protein n=1 Tax=Aidingimonas lacisalsi TaxID=2604086 RepID=UPI0011D2069E|nr:zf-HC2 domain-containing protein [Aidingimonas lacisalsi]
MTRRTLTCEEVIEQLFDYLDQELDDQRQADIEQHLAKCRDCFSRAEFERRLRDRMEALTQVPAPHRLHRRIRSLLDQFDDESNSTT